MFFTNHFALADLRHPIVTSLLHLHASLLPVVGEWPRRCDDDADVRRAELLREEVRLRSADDGALERGVELRLDFGLERDDRRDDIHAARLHDQGYFALCIPCKLRSPGTVV